MGFLDLIFPKKCFGCGKEGRYICRDCLSKLKTAKAICPMCGKGSVDGMTHSACLRPMGIDGLVSPWRYEGVIRTALLAVKYRFAFDIAREISQDAVDFMSEGFNPLPKDGILVPVPIYKDRTNWRGFNQAEEIGKIVAKELNLGFNSELLIKKVKTKPQTELDRKERLKNLQGAFSLNPHFPARSAKLRLLPINHHSLILFDDIWTTGTTLKEAVKVLKRTGVGKVWGLTLARS